MTTERIVRGILRGWVVLCLVFFAVAAVIGCCGLVAIVWRSITLLQ